MARTLPRALLPFGTPAYRWLFASLVCSILHAGITIVALVWQVVALGGGPGELSVVTASGAVGMLVTTLLGGALADRIPQRRILAAVEVVNALALGAVGVLALLGVIAVWHLAAASLVAGIVAGLYYPAYSALLPALLPAEELLPANGIEGAVRPIFVQALGPALGSAIIALATPGAALVVAAGAAVLAAGFVLRVPVTPLRRELSDDGRHPVASVLRDIGEGFGYVWRTPWLLATLAYASLLVLIIMGPLEVLVPFAIKDEAGGGPREHAFVLAAFGLGGAIGSLVVASRRLPRRYLTTMNLLWGLACLPLLVFGTTGSVLIMVLAGFVIGALFQAPMVIWGTLLQRRVPPELLGRVSSLDFFVSLAFMPISMGLAGAVSEWIGLRTTFLIAAVVPPVLAVIAVLAARMPADEIAHPLDVPADGGDLPAADDALVTVTAMVGGSSRSGTTVPGLVPGGIPPHEDDAGDRQR